MSSFHDAQNHGDHAAGGNPAFTESLNRTEPPVSYGIDARGTDYVNGLPQLVRAENRVSLELQFFPFALDGEMHEIAVGAFDDFYELRPGADLLAFCGDDSIVGAQAGAICGHS